MQTKLFFRILLSIVQCTALVESPKQLTYDLLFDRRPTFCLLSAWLHSLEICRYGAPQTSAGRSDGSGRHSDYEVSLLYYRSISCKAVMRRDRIRNSRCDRIRNSSPAEIFERIGLRNAMHQKQMFLFDSFARSPSVRILSSIPLMTGFKWVTLKWTTTEKTSFPFPWHVIFFFFFLGGNNE